MIIKKKTLRRGKEELSPESPIVETDNDGAEEIFGTDSLEDEETSCDIVVQPHQEEPQPAEIENPEDIDLFSLDNIDFRKGRKGAAETDGAVLGGLMIEILYPEREKKPIL